LTLAYSAKIREVGSLLPTVPTQILLSDCNHPRFPMSSAPDPLWIDDEKVTGFAVCHTSSLRAAEAQRVKDALFSIGVFRDLHTDDG